MNIHQIQRGLTVRVRERQRTGYFKAPGDVRLYARPEFEETITLPATTGVVDDILLAAESGNDDDQFIVVVRTTAPDGEGYYECAPSEIEAAGNGG